MAEGDSNGDQQMEKIRAQVQEEVCKTPFAELKQEKDPFPTDFDFQIETARNKLEQYRAMASISSARLAFLLSKDKSDENNDEIEKEKQTLSELFKEVQELRKYADSLNKMFDTLLELIDEEPTEGCDDQKDVKSTQKVDEPSIEVKELEVVHIDYEEDSCSTPLVIDSEASEDIRSDSCICLD